MSITKLQSLAVLGGLVLLATVPVAGQKSDKHQHGHTSSSLPKVAEIQPVSIPKLAIPDVEVLDQEGRKQKCGIL